MTDEKNGLKAFIDVGHVKGKPKDHFEGHIERISTGEKLTSVRGSYCGFVNFDDSRYLDIR